MRRTVMMYGVVMRGPLLHLEVPSGVGAVKGITGSIADDCPPRVRGCKAEESLELPGGSVHSGTLIPCSNAPIKSMSMRRTVMKYGVVVRGPWFHLEVP
eukprot:CAMPEP_0182862826 /NCGR_PEP_ID=MMETSP0034_2-20130328/6299_1 /TAXON_ID=156128 /ORGANISM="Nephroselmis pyriformis, Strain CCMP717" /LENGTH=98 /DNA_ID=CAMNT_0024994961 /DNA_START=67 /DNA_END=363 /DNA_ORIENTATION=+